MSKTLFCNYCALTGAETDSVTELHAQLAAYQQAAQSSAAQAKSTFIELARLRLQAEAAAAEAGVAQQKAGEASVEAGKLRKEVCERGAVALDAERRLEVAELRLQEVVAAAAMASAASSSSAAEVRRVRGLPCSFNLIIHPKRP